MKKLNFTKVLLICIMLLIANHVFSQQKNQDTSKKWHVERERPKEWESLAPKTRFIDRFLPIPVVGELRSDVWGSDAVLPRYIYDGIEEDEYAYWGGNIRKGDDGKFHLIVCGWEEEIYGHWGRESKVFHAVSDNSMGPYKVIDRNIGLGHNPEFYRLKDGRYIIYVIGAYYIANDINGPWEKKKFEFDQRDRSIIEGLSNVTFAQREDGSYLAVCRGGGIWISETGESKYMQVTNGVSCYPKFEGKYEDPVVWRTNIQYHMVVNDWYGRVAYYLRSKDGFIWKNEPGEAYMPGISKYEDGTNVGWYKYERIKVVQDEYGRAYQANFSVTDTAKIGNLANDKHNTKNHCIPLMKGKLIELLNKKQISSNTEELKLKVLAEEGFNPHTDIDLKSLRFGAPEVINYGGGSKVLSTKKDGNDLIIIFDSKGNGLTDSNFAGKLFGKTIDGKLLFGYSRLAWVNYNESVLSARKPKVINTENKRAVEIEVQNYGQISSKTTDLKIEFSKGDDVFTMNTKVGSLSPYEKTTVQINTSNIGRNLEDYKVKIYTNEQKLLLFDMESSVKIDH